MAVLTPISMVKMIKIRTKFERGVITMEEAETLARPFMKN